MKRTKKWTAWEKFLAGSAVVYALWVGYVVLAPIHAPPVPETIIAAIGAK